jgi:hypothetical protein
VAQQGVGVCKPTVHLHRPLEEPAENNKTYRPSSRTAELP